MSSLRNSLHRRNHKERGQLAHRSKLGILEKHKDYVLRARDFHSKQDRIKRLREKAASRNKDEFYFGMANQRTKEGVHIQDRGNQSLPVDIVKVLKTQDGNYIRAVRSAGLKKIDKLRGELGSMLELANAKENGGVDDDSNENWEDEGFNEEEMATLRAAGLLRTADERPSRNKRRPATPRHVLFAENEEDARQHVSSSKQGIASQDPLKTEEHESPDLGWLEHSGKSLRKRKRTAKALDNSVAQPVIDKSKKHRKSLVKELSARLSRDRSLRYADRELEMQRLLMGKGRVKKISGLEKIEDEKDDEEDEVWGRGRKRVKVDEQSWKPKVYKWKTERKR